MKGCERYPWDLWSFLMSESSTYTGPCDAELDASGLSCPLPLLKAKMELNRLASGSVLKVTATDAGSQRDFRTFAQLSGHALIGEQAQENVFHYWLRKA